MGAGREDDARARAGAAGGGRRFGSRCGHRWTTSSATVRRGVARDATSEDGTAGAEALHRARYLAAEHIYIDEVDPVARADVVVDNTDIDRPRLLRG